MKKTVTKILLPTFLLLILFSAVYLFQLYSIRLYVVGGDSMLPTISRNSLVVVKGTEAVFQEGDIVTYKFQNSPNVIVTHRIIEVLKENQLYATQGDNSRHLDPYPVAHKEILGTVIFHIPHFDLLYNFWVIGLLVYLPAGYLFGARIALVKELSQK